MFMLQWSSVGNQIPTHWNPIGNTNPAAANVIAQQYSPATFVSLRFQSQKKTFGTFEKCPSLHFHFKKCVSLKFRNQKLCKLGSICTANGLMITRSPKLEDIDMPAVIPYLL